MMKKRIAFQTLGCRLNQYETDSIATDFRRGGYEIVDFEDFADCYIINTCTVTDRSDRKSRNLINRALRQDSRELDEGSTAALSHVKPIVVATGCYVDGKPSYFDEHPDIDYVIGNDEKYRIFDLVDAYFRKELRGGDMSGDDPDAAVNGRFAFGDALDGFHTRANIKIQDGCDNFCTFCIIPYVRGAGVSRSATDVIEHAKRVIDAGAKELVLTGVNMGRYDDDGVLFVDLVRRLLSLPGDFRIRLSSLEPDIRGEGFAEVTTHEKFAPHLHLCLQSGSDRILLAMRRQYDVAGFVDFVDSIRRRDQDFNFTTDVIVGFPGETETEFSETISIIRDIGFSHIHTFPYSKRTGTRAERLPDHVDEKTRARRSADVRSLGTELKRTYRSGFVGRREKVLIEKVLVDQVSSEGVMSGYSAHYLPVRVPVDIDRASQFRNTFVDVDIAQIEDGDEPLLIGEL